MDKLTAEEIANFLINGSQNLKGDGARKTLYDTGAEMINNLVNQKSNRLTDALLCNEFIAMHEEEFPENLKTDKEKNLHSALNKIYRISHVSREPECFDRHEEWEKEFQEFIKVVEDW